MLQKSAKKGFVLKIFQFFKKQTLLSTCVETGITLMVSDSVTQTVENYIFTSVGSDGDDWHRLGRFTLIGTALIVSFRMKWCFLMLCFIGFYYHLFFLGTSCIFT